MGLQVALEIQDLQLIRLLQRQELAQGRIGLDDLLVHQTLLARVGANAGRDLAARDLGALGDAEELGQRIRDGRGAVEDRLLLGLVGITLRLARAATLGGLLQLLGNLLLQDLELRVDRGDGRAQRVDLLDGGRDAGGDVHLLRVGLGGGDGVDGRRRGNRRRGRRGDGHGGGRRGGSSGRRGGGGLGLTTSGLGGSGSGSGRRGHFSYDGGRGSFVAKQTREYCLPLRRRTFSILAGTGGKNETLARVCAFISYTKSPPPRIHKGRPRI